jgi:hypothetical protein
VEPRCEGAHSQLRPLLGRLVNLCPLLLEVLPDLPPRHLHRRRILHRRRNLHLLFEFPVHRILHQLPQDPPQRLATAGLGDHAFTLDHATERGYRSDLFADQLLDFFDQLIGWDGRGGVVGCGERDEGEGEVAFQRIWDSDDAALSDCGM